MNTPNDTDRLFAELADKIRREAYAEGWRDAFATLEAALAEYKETPDIKDKIGSNGPTFTRLPTRITGENLPKLGTTPHAILSAVTSNPGMTGGEIVEVVKNTGHTAPVGSIQTNIQRLKKRKLIVLRHGKWYPE